MREVRLRTVSGGGSVTFTVPLTQLLVLFGVAPVTSYSYFCVSYEIWVLFAYWPNNYPSSNLTAAVNGLLGLILR